MVRKELEKVLTEQILDLKVNGISPCKTEMYPIYLDRTEKDNSKWLDMLLRELNGAKTFEIHCWNEESEWIEVYNKMTPFFNVFLDDAFQSCHYGTEIYVEEKK